MDTITFTALADRYATILASPDGGRTEQQWLDDVLPRVAALDTKAVALINEHTRRGTLGFVETTEFVPVVRSLAAEHPDAFTSPEYSRTVTGLLNGSHVEACRLLAKMADEGTAPAAAGTSDVSATLDVLRNEVDEAAKSHRMERLDSAQLETRMLISESTRKRREAKGLLGFIQTGSKHGKRYLWVNGRPLTKAEVLSLWNSDGSTRVTTVQHGPKTD